MIISTDNQHYIPISYVGPLCSEALMAEVLFPSSLCLILLLVATCARKAMVVDGHGKVALALLAYCSSFVL